MTDSFQKMQWKNFSKNNSSWFHLADLQLKRLECIFLWMISLVTGHVACISLVHCVLHNLLGITKNGLKSDFTFFLILWQEFSQDIYVNQKYFKYFKYNIEFVP